VTSAAEAAEAAEAQATRAAAFRHLHEAGPPLLLANAWSAASARIAEVAGAAALGTTSFGLALDHGRTDGALPMETGLAVLTEVVAAVDVPVSFDLEAGRGATPEDVGRSMAAVIATGAVGVNLEDAVPGQPGVLFPVEVQAERLRAARGAADAAGVPMFINARCDVFFGAQIPDERRVDEVLARADVYRAAGADGLFLPGLVDLATITALAAQVGLPINVMVVPGLPDLDTLTAAGVRRVSQGGAGFIAMAGALHTTTAAYVGGELHPPLDAVMAGVSVLPALAR
jgi:2-methylisocitrate lyase-like PEP mutase family enzyme